MTLVEEADEFGVGDVGRVVREVLVEEVTEPGVGDFECNGNRAAVGGNGGGGEGGEVGSLGEAIPQPLSLRSARSLPYLLDDGGCLCLVGARLVVKRAMVSLADNGLRVEVAKSRRGDDAIHQAIQTITSRDDCCINGVKLARKRDIAFVVHDNKWPLLRRGEVVPLDGWRFGQDTVVVSRVNLGLDKALTTSGRAAVPVRVCCRRAVVALGDGFTDERHVMIRTVAKVEQKILVDIAGAGKSPR